MAGSVLNSREILRIDRLVYVPVILLLIGIWAVTIDFKLDDRTELLTTAAADLYSSAESVADAEILLLRNAALSEAERKAIRAGTIQDELRHHTGAHIWLESNGTIFAGGAIDLDPATSVTATETRDGFTVHAAQSKEDVLSGWHGTFNRWIVILSIVTVTALAMAALLARTLRRSAIAEMNLRKRDAILSTINNAATALAAAEDFETVINDVLASIGKAVGVDRVTLRTFARFTDVGRVFEWHAPDLVPFADAIQTASDDFKAFYKPEQLAQAMRGEPINFAISDAPADWQDFLRSSRTLSSLIFAFIVDDQVNFVLNFSEARRPDRRWTATEKDTLRTLAGVIAAAITRTHQVRERRKAEAKLFNRDAILEAMTETAAKLLNADDPDTAINETLAGLGPALGLSRIYLAAFRQSDDGRIFVSLTHEWYKAGMIPGKGHPAFTDAEVTALYPPERFAKATSGWEDAFYANDLPPAEKASLVEIGALASLAVPVQVDGEFQANLVFADDSPERHSWSTTEVSTLKTLTQLVGAALARARYLERTQKAMMNVLARESALEGISQGITIADTTLPRFPMIYANPAFAVLVRCAPEQLIGMSALSFSESSNTARHEEDIALALKERKSWRVETPLRRSDGSTFIAGVSTSVIRDQNGLATHIISITEDITELRKREELLLEARKMEGIGHLTGGIAHEFNNLLTAIRSNAEDLRDDLQDELQRTQAEIVLEAADRGAGLVAQLLAFARKQELAPENVAINALVASFAKQLARTLPANIEIETKFADDLPAVHVDPGRLEGAIQHLAFNARDAMPDGGTITIETSLKILDDVESAEMSARPGAYVLIAVTDSGGGMGREILAKAFTPFFTTKEVGKGTGLGLSMVDGFAKQSGGYARIYSELGMGAVVKLYLPVIAAMQADAAAVPARAPGPSAILIVDDDDEVRESVGKRLKGLGYQVTAATNAQEAIDILKGRPHFDLVFSDIIMPGGMNGADLVGEVRRRWPATGVLLMSGYTESTIFAKVKLPPDARLLSKPFSNHELASAVREALERRKVA